MPHESIFGKSKIRISRVQCKFIGALPRQNITKSKYKKQRSILASESVFFSQAEGLHDRTAKSEEEVAALQRRAARSLRPRGTLYDVRFTVLVLHLSCSFFQRKSQRRPRGENDREAAAHLAERSRKTTLIARSFRALGVRRLLRPTFSHRGITQACGLPRNARTQDRTIPQIG